MKEMLFKNRETGEYRTIYIDERISNIAATHSFREANGKQWGLVQSRQTRRK